MLMRLAGFAACLWSMPSAPGAGTRAAAGGHGLVATQAVTPSTRWRVPPRVLRLDSGDTVFVNQPRPIPVGGRIALLGFPTVVSRLAGGPVLQAGVMVSRGATPVATPIPLPPGQRMLRALVASSGLPKAGVTREAHVLWSGRSDVRPGEPDTIWYARWDGRRWSPPERAWTGAGIRWDEGNASLPIVDSRSVDVLVPYDAPSGGGPSGLLRLHRDAAGWRARRVAVRGSRPFAVSARRTSDGGTLVAFIGAMRLPTDTATARSGGTADPSAGLRVLDQNSVFVARVEADTLADVRRIYAGVGARAQELNIAHGTRDRFALIWLAQGSGGMGRKDALLAASTTDGGRSFRLWPPRDLGAPAERLRILDGRAGVESVTFTTGFPVLGEGVTNAAAPPRADSTGPCDSGGLPGQAVWVAAADGNGGWSTRKLSLATTTTAAGYASGAGPLVVWSSLSMRGSLPTSCIGGI